MELLRGSPSLFLRPKEDFHPFVCCCRRMFLTLTEAGGFLATLARDKYQLKTLHEEIDLFDRKLAHLLKYDTFATETAREASAAKLRAKRELLAPRCP